MKQIEALAKLTSLGQPVFETKDAAACLAIDPAYASKVLSRLEEAGFVSRLIRPKWVLISKAQTLTVAEHLTAPLPTYISLQTALFYHGMISQIPEVIYCVSLARTRRYQTPMGVFSVHHIEPEFFFGYEVTGKEGIKMASPEKALLDIFYLSPARTGLFKTLPEIELQENFSAKLAQEMIQRIPSHRRRQIVRRKFEILISEKIRAGGI